MCLSTIGHSIVINSELVHDKFNQNQLLSSFFFFCIAPQKLFSHCITYYALPWCMNSFHLACLSVGAQWYVAPTI